jgi:predicted nucleic acid-binding protein
MSGNSFVIDTNVVSYYLLGDRSLTPYFKNTQVYISFITELELRSLPSISQDVMQPLNTFLDTCLIIEFNENIKDLAVIYKRDYKLKLPDALIAATASYFNTTLVTSDRVFMKLKIPIILYHKKP